MTRASDAPTLIEHLSYQIFAVTTGLELNKGFQRFAKGCLQVESRDIAARKFRKE
jgi:hypothetical protein